MENYMYLVPVAAVIALIFAAYLARKVGRQSAGTERMKENAAAIAEGARAFLTAEYKILIIFVAVLFVLIGIGIGNWVTAICFVVGALFSTVAGYCGMTVATKANVRTANAAKESGMNKALSIAWYDPLFSFYRPPLRRLPIFPRAAAGRAARHCPFSSRTNASGFAVSSAQAGTKPHFTALRTDLMFDHAAQ